MTVAEPAPTLALPLLEAIRRATGDPTLEFDGTPVQLSGGFWAELLSFRLRGGPASLNGALVARVMPDPGTAAKETVFQSELAALGFPTPAVHLAGDASAGIEGRAYFVMDLVAGQMMLGGLGGFGAVRKLPSLIRRMPVVLAGTLAALHRIDTVPIVRRLEDAGVPRPGIETMLPSLLDTADRLGRIDLHTAAQWLRAHRPAHESTVVCHGDLHPFNVLVAERDAVMVLDWSAALLAPAVYDVGFTSLVLAEPPLLVPRVLRPPIRAAGRALARRFVRAYERAAGYRVDPSSLAWHQALVCLRALTEVAGWVATGSVDERAGHPWLINGEAFASRLAALTGTSIRPR